MNRLTRRLLSLLAVVFLLLFALPLSVMAESSATLISLNYDISLLATGDARITETRTVAFSGDTEFSRYGFGNAFTGPRVFYDWQVTMDGAAFARLDVPDNDTRPENTFAIEESEWENTVFIYHRSTNVTRTFTVSYTVKNAVKLYEDVGEFSWNLTGTSGLSDIEQLTATLHIPAGVPTEDFRIWAHGPLHGSFEKLDAASAYLKIDSVAQNELIDIRATIPASFFTGGWEQDGAGLAAILEKEKELAERANQQREEEEQRKAEEEAYWAERHAWEATHPILTAIESFCLSIYDFFYYNIAEQFAGVLCGGGLCVFILPALFSGNKRKAKKARHTPSQSPAYYRTLPDEKPSPVVDRLLHFYKGNGSASTSRQISATLLELYLKQLLHFRTNEKETEILLSKTAGNTVFATETAAETYQGALWRFLQSAADEAGHLSVRSLKSYVQEHTEDASHFRCAFEGAVDKVYAECVQTEEVKGPRLRDNKALFWIAAGIGILATLICMGSTLYDGSLLLSSLLIGGIAFAVALFFGVLAHMGRTLFGKSCHILTQQSEDSHALWQAFGRFLDDFTTFSDKELPEFPVWRKYMVYAVAMGKGKTVAEALAVKYPDALQTEDAFDDEYDRFLREMALYDALNDIGRELVSASAPHTSEHSDNGSGDNWSNSDGGGGGFSASNGGSDSGSTGDFAD